MIYIQTKGCTEQPVNWSTGKIVTSSKVVYETEINE